MKISSDAFYFGKDAYLELNLVNSGRHATTVNEVGFRLMSTTRRKRFDALELERPGNKVKYWTSSEVDFPQRLEAQSEITVKVEFGDDQVLVDH